MSNARQTGAKPRKYAQAIARFRTLRQAAQSVNRLLASLSPSSATRLISACTYVELPLGTYLSESNAEPRFLYFLTSGMASVVFTSERGSTIEVATLGAEGLVGWAYLLGTLLPPSICHMQVAGAAYRVPLAAMQREFDQHAEVRQRVLEYTQHQIIVSNQVLACNRLHRSLARFARWMLMVSDRLGSDEVMMTQEFMSNMLGTRRTTVAEVCAELGRAGALEGRRGGVRIVDRAVLESYACECYRVLRTCAEPLYNRHFSEA